MEKPNLEEIKERYKYAKSVRCLFDGRVYQNIINIHKYKTTGIFDYWCEGYLENTDVKHDVYLYDTDRNTYAEITEYKTKEIPVKHEEIKHRLQKHFPIPKFAEGSVMDHDGLMMINDNDKVKIELDSKIEKEFFFDKVVDDTLNQIKETLLIKAKEYRRNNNPFHNFEEGAKITGLTREKVLDGMLLKHEISIKDITNDLDFGILPSENIVNEKFGDNIIYLIIKKASILDRINKNNLNSK